MLHRLWSQSQPSDERTKALIDAELQTNTNLALNIADQQLAPDVITQLLDTLKSIERHLAAPSKPPASIGHLGIMAGGSATRRLVLRPDVQWQLDTILLTTRLGATGTFVLDIAGLAADDIVLSVTAGAALTQSIGLPIGSQTTITVTDHGSGNGGLCSIDIICVPV